MVDHAKCDKCGCAVQLGNSAVIIDALADGSDLSVALNRASGYNRHFLPVKVGDAVLCEGSPSRAQYIEGQPRDMRDYPYLPDKHEARFRTAYDRVLGLYPLQPGF